MVMEVIGIASKSTDWSGTQLPELAFVRTQSMLKTLFECQGADGNVADCLAGAQPRLLVSWWARACAAETCGRTHQYANTQSPCS